jgi:hypothetical protein
MTDGQNWGQEPQYPPQGYGQQYPQDQPWQPQQYDSYAHQQRIGGGQPSFPPQGQPWLQPGYGQQPYPGQTQYAPGPQPPAPPQEQPGYGQPPWTPQQPVHGPGQPHRRKSWPGRHKVLTGLIAAGAIVIIAVAASASNKPSTPTANTAAAGSTASPSAAVSSARASSAPSTPAAPASPSMTGAQQQAVDAAQEYLSEGQGFSEQGLLSQLTSSAGNGFSNSDAEFAISHLSPDWDAQAVDAANGYLSEGQGFSEQGLFQQLTANAGDGFTESQAEYAINSVHPDWDAQAVDAAKGYMQMGGFSQASLIQQLTSSAGNGFTQAQAEYAASQVGL